MTFEKVKIVTFVPIEHADAVRDALGSAGAGKIGEYSFNSFSIVGHGRFFPSNRAKPVKGSNLQINILKEDRIEVVCARQNAKEAIAAMKQVHPYEEVDFDIYPLISEADL